MMCLLKVPALCFNVFSGICPNNYGPNCTAWTGGNDIEVEGQYRWSFSNVTLNFTSWRPNQPSVISPRRALPENCIDLTKNGGWNDKVCSYLSSFICEMTIGQ
jgi:hypothetical protein